MSKTKGNHAGDGGNNTAWALLMLTAPSAIRQRTVERWQSEGDPKDPEELRIWRAITYYREELLRWHRTNLYSARKAGRLARFQVYHSTKDKTQAASAEVEWRAAYEAVGNACKVAADDLDRRIRRRRKKAPPPRDILADLMQPYLPGADAAVEAYLATPAPERKRALERTWAALLVISKNMPVRFGSLDELVTAGREWQRESNRSGSLKLLARYVVNRVAGLPPESRKGR